MRKKNFKNAQHMARSFLIETNVIESYNDLESHLENITNDFLRFANEFNQIPTAYFELEPSSASH
ncbi:hypothetical protein HpHA38_01920 [Helicobacter pylori]